MKKVLLVFEDYSEMTNTEVYLKKIGFDVVGIGNEVLMSDKLLQFNPDVVVASGKSQKVSSLSVGMKLRENHKYHGKTILVINANTRPSAQEIARVRMDATLESPVLPAKLIQVLAKFTNQDFVQLVEKFRKATLTDPALKQIFHVTGEKQFDNLIENVSDGDRVARYQKYLQSTQIEPGFTSFQKNELKERQKELKKGWDFDELERLDELKREFADALFKKA